MEFLGRALIGPRAAPRRAVTSTLARVSGCNCGATPLAAEVLRALGVTTVHPSGSNTAAWRLHIAQERAGLIPALRAVGEAAHADRLEADHVVYLRLLDYGVPLPSWPGSLHSTTDHSALEDALAEKHAPALLAYAAKETVRVSGTMGTMTLIGTHATASTSTTAVHTNDSTWWPWLLAGGATGLGVWLGGWSWGLVAGGIAGGTVLAFGRTNRAPPVRLGSSAKLGIPGSLWTPFRSDPLSSHEIVLATKPLQPAPRGVPYAEDGDAFSDPFGENHGAPLPNGTLLPATSPRGAPWLLWHGSHSAPFSNAGHPNLGLDADGVFWSYGVLGRPGFVPKYGFGATKDPDPIRLGWRVVSFSGPSGLDVVIEIVTTYVLPVLAVAVAAVIPGAGGVLAGAIFAAAAKMAQGGSITDAVVGATRDALPALRDNRAFDQAYTAASSLYEKGAATSAVVNLANKAKAALTTPEQRTAYDQGLAMALGQKGQAEGVAWLKGALPAKAGLIDLAMEHGAALVDVADVLGGPPAVAKVRTIAEFA